MAAMDLTCTNYWKMKQVTSGDFSSCYERANNLAEEIKNDARRDLATRLASEAYGSDGERLRKDVTKVSLLDPDVTLNEGEALHLLMFISKVTRGALRADGKSD